MVMAQIEYCLDEASWHPVLDLDLCPDDDWFGHEETSRREDILVAALEIDQREFFFLAKRWKRETALDGSLQKIVIHDDYQRIMAMGPGVIVFILRDLAIKPAHWFWALHNLVPQGEDPAEGITTIEAARQAWLKWGRDNNLL
jgi:hypothetical protein